MILVGLEVIQEMEEQRKSIRKRIKEAPNRHKSYANVHRIDHDYEVGDKVSLRVK
jgi:ribosomal protein L21E